MKRLIFAAVNVRETHLAQTDSTNGWLRQHPSQDDQLVVADYQTAGRGCGANTWESEPGSNLLFSLSLHPRGVKASRQFLISMAHAVALADAVGELTGGLSLKWPNDLYWRDLKLGGTLIETTLQGDTLRQCIIGTGINVNQLTFRSDAPNPVSLRAILGREVSREELLRRILHHQELTLAMLQQGRDEALKERYLSKLYRRGEAHTYRLPAGQMLRLTLTGVDFEGRAHFLTDQGEERAFAFKEVAFVIGPSERNNLTNQQYNGKI